MSYKETIMKDKSRYGKSFSKAWSFPGFRFLFWIRIASHFSKINPIGFFARVIVRIMQIRFGFQIPHITKIGGGLYLGHFGGIVISNQAEIGENCNIAQGVTIGRINKGSKKGAPRIGNQVWIGANSVIVGKIKVGDNVLIAPLSFVNMDVPENCMVMGNPATIIEGKTSIDYINSYI